MGLSRKLLGEDEQELLHLRAHAKALIGPVVILIVVVAAAGLALGLMPTDWRPWGPWATIAVAAALLVIGTLVPWLRWLTTTCTLTDHRVITRRGILRRTGHDVPLHRIDGVSYRRGFTDRILGCGTLVLTTAIEEPMILPDVPHIKRVQIQVCDAVFASRQIAGSAQGFRAP